MESYSDSIFMLGFSGIFISIISGITYVICKRTLKYAWVFGCVLGFCFFTAFRHISFQIGYGDITDPSYEVYKDWNIYSLIASDIIRLFIWLGIGILNYLAFIKQNKLIKYLFILVTGIFLIFMVLLMVLSSMTIAM